MPSKKPADEIQTTLEVPGVLKRPSKNIFKDRMKPRGSVFGSNDTRLAGDSRIINI